MKYRENELNRMYKTLTEDLLSILGKSKKISQAKRRSYIRAFVSLIEFDTFSRKQLVLHLQHSGLIKFNVSEIMLLTEIQPEIDNKGDIKEKQKFIRLIDNYRFAIRMFCKATHIDFVLPTDNQGWNSFKATVELRNKITHPKNEDELNITDENMKTVLNAFKWFSNNDETIIKLLENVMQPE